MKITFIKNKALSIVVSIALVLTVGTLAPLTTPPASAATTTSVTNFAGLQSAITSSTAGDTIQLSNDIVQTATLTISKAVTIDGKGFQLSVPTPGLEPSGLEALSPSTFSMFSVTTTTEATIKNITLVGGKASGGINVNAGAKLKLSNVKIERCLNTSGGGALINSGSLTMENSFLRRNSATYGGGLLNSSGATLIMTNSSLVENRTYGASAGGGMENKGTMWVSNSTFANNLTNSAGGAINNMGGSLNVANSTFVGNLSTGPYGGGAIFNWSGASLKIASSIFAYNYSKNGSSGTSLVLDDFHNVAATDLGSSSITIAHSLVQTKDIWASTDSTYASAYINQTNVTDYAVPADGTGDTLFSGGSYDYPTDGYGQTLTSYGKLYRPNLLVQNGLPTAAIASGNTTLGLAGAPVDWSPTTKFAYYNGTTWTNLVGTGSTAQTLTTDQIGAVRSATVPRVGSLEGSVAQTFTVQSPIVVGGSVSGASMYGDTYAANSTATITAVPASGKTFTSWSLSKNGAAATTSTTNPLVLTVDGNYTVTPIFGTAAAGSRSVTYSGAGADSGVPPSSVTSSADITIATNSGNLVRANYTLTGWNTSSNGSGTSYAFGAVYASTSTANLTLYPVWTYDAPVAPGAPGTPVATAGNEIASLVWTAPATGTGPITYSVVSTPAGANCSISALTASCTGLTNGTAYTFIVVATNSGGTTNSGSSTSITPFAAVVPTTGAMCDGTLTQNGVKVTAGHGKNFYIDTGQGQLIDAGYLAYQVKSSSARSDLWVQVSDFNGGVVSLANPADANQPLGAVAANGTKSVFYMVKASGPTTVAQSHVVKVYASKPTIGQPLPLYTCSFSFTRVDETIKALANKVVSTTSTTSTVIGSTMTITVTGDTGTIGQGNDIDGKVIWLSPAARSGWPTNAVRLIGTTADFYSDSGMGTQVGTQLVDTLRANSTNFSQITSASRLFYRAVYTFRIIGGASAPAPIVPVAMISSGTQIKHNDVSGAAPGTLNLTAPTLAMAVTKDVQSTLTVSADGTTTMHYTVKLNNTGANELAVDEVVDHPDPALSFVTGSAKFDGVSIPDAGQVTGGLAFSGPFYIPANSFKTITYDMVVETCKPGGTFSYENTATAQVGSVILGSASATQSLVTLSGACGSSSGNVVVEDIPLAPTATTLPVDTSTITATTATIPGLYDSNSVAGLPVRFVYGTSLTSTTALSSGTSTAAAGNVAVSQSLTGLTPGTTYYYRVEIQQNGVWIQGEVLSFTTPIPAAPPTVVTNQPSAVTQTSAQLNGSIDANAVVDGAKAKFEIVASATCPPSAGYTGAFYSPSTGVIQTESATAGVYIDAIFDNQNSTPTSEATQLTASTSYCYRVIALYNVGSATDYSSSVLGDWVQFTSVAMLPQVLVWNSTTQPLPAGGSTTVAAVENSSIGETSIVYTSNDTSICTVNAATGVVIAVAKEGICSITAIKAGHGIYYAAQPITITFPISPPVITTPAVSDGVYRSAYSNTLDATGGDGSYSNWTISSGSLPPGLTLDPATGIISGTATNAGIYEFMVTTVSNGVTSEPHPYTIIIDKVTVTVTASSRTVTYGSSVPTIVPSWTGLVGGDTVATVKASPNIVPICTTTYTATTAVAATAPTTTCANGWAENYSYVYVAGSVTITKLALVVTALDASKPAGQLLDPAFSYVVSPSLPAGATLSSVLGTMQYSRPFGEEAGQYAITPLASNVNANYTVTYINGTLTITPKLVPVLATTNSVITYGTDLTGLLDASATESTKSVPGTYSYTYVNEAGETVTLAEGDLLDAGIYTVTVIFTPTDTAKYFGPVEKSFTITVNPKAVKVKALRQAKQNLLASTSTTVAVDPSLSYTVLTALPVGKTVKDVFPNGASVSRADSGVNPGKHAGTTWPTGESPSTYEATVSGEPSSNYTVTVVSDDFVITQKIVPDLTPTDHTITEGTSLQGLLNTTASFDNTPVAGTFNYTYLDDDGAPVTVTESSKLPMGTYYLTVDFLPADTTTYYGAVQTVMNVNVTRASITPPQSGPTDGSTGGTPSVVPTTDGGAQTAKPGTPISITPNVTNAASQCLIDPVDLACKAVVTIKGEGTWTLKDGVATFVPVKGFIGKSIVVHQVTSTDGKIAKANLQAIYGNRPPVKITIGNFIDGSPKITATIANKIRAFVKKYGDYRTIECIGFTEGPTVLKTDKLLSKQRASNACAYVSKTLKKKFLQKPLKAGQDTVQSSQRRRVTITLTD